jgi:hypothetical protein
MLLPSQRELRLYCLGLVLGATACLAWATWG